MENYTAVNQTEDELEKSSLDYLSESGFGRPRSPYLFFASGFVAAVLTALILVVSYQAINSGTGQPPGLIPDCKPEAFDLFRTFWLKA